MSLFKPSHEDYEDAHTEPQTQDEYNAKVLELSQTSKEDYQWKFEAVPGFFVQSAPGVDELEFNYIESNLGRLKSWKEIQAGVAKLNESAQPNESYKVIFCARHGQGFHNQIVAKYGLDAWYSKWNVLGRDGDVVYGPDPMLTEKGIAQAKQNHDAWKDEIEVHGAPMPSKFYVSPLQRSLWTCVYTWEGLRPATVSPVVVENLRETIGVHLCDKRSTKTVISERFGKHGFVFEDGFTEEDERHSMTRETLVEQALRVNTFCQRLFEDDWDVATGHVDKASAQKNAFVSTTTHAGTIRAFITVFNHRLFTISTGGMIPIVVKATRN